jgi:hypothetical protein
MTKDILVKIISDLLECGSQDVAELVDIHERFQTFNVQDYRERIGNDMRIEFNDILLLFIGHAKELLMKELDYMDGITKQQVKKLKGIINEVSLATNYSDWGGIVNDMGEYNDIAYIVKEFVTEGTDDDAKTYVEQIVAEFQEEDDEELERQLKEIIIRHFNENDEYIALSLSETPIEDIMINNEFVVNKNIYKVLQKFLDIDKQSLSFQVLLDEMIKESDEPEGYVMEQFAERYDEGNNELRITNTYNSDNFISSDIEYITFETGDKTSYIIIRVHNGTDIRSGYSVPKVFCLWPYNLYDFEIELGDIEFSVSNSKGKELFKYENGRVIDVDESIKGWNIKVENNKVYIRKNEKDEWEELEIN